MINLNRDKIVFLKESLNFLKKNKINVNTVIFEIKEQVLSIILNSDDFQFNILNLKIKHDDGVYTILYNNFCEMIMNTNTHLQIKPKDDKFIVKQGETIISFAVLDHSSRIKFVKEFDFNTLSNNNFNEFLITSKKYHEDYQKINFDILENKVYISISNNNMLLYKTIAQNVDMSDTSFSLSIPQISILSFMISKKNRMSDNVVSYSLSDEFLISKCDNMYIKFKYMKSMYKLSDFSKDFSDKISFNAQEFNTKIRKMIKYLKKDDTIILKFQEGNISFIANNNNTKIKISKMSCKHTKKIQINFSVFELGEYLTYNNSVSKYLIKFNDINKHIMLINNKSKNKCLMMSNIIDDIF